VVPPRWLKKIHMSSRKPVLLFGFAPMIFGISRGRFPRAMGPRWPKMAPRRPQDGARGPKKAPRWPRMDPRRPPRWPKTAPRRPQDGPRQPVESATNRGAEIP